MPRSYERKRALPVGHGRPPLDTTLDDGRARLIRPSPEMPQEHCESGRT